MATLAAMANRASLMACGLAAVLLAGGARAQSSPPRQTGADVVVTPDKGDAGDAMGRAATRPLRDLNIVKPRLDPALEAVMPAPYRLKGLNSCRQLGREVNRMTGLVGPDVDDPRLLRRKGQSPVELLGEGAESMTGSLIPGQGVIRAITGANKAQRHAQAARLAGQLRRSYLKGVMAARGCRPVPLPATTAPGPNRPAKR